MGVVSYRIWLKKDAFFSPKWCNREVVGSLRVETLTTVLPLVSVTATLKNHKGL